MRAASGKMAVRLGVEGSLSPMNSPMARTVKTMAVILCEAQKAQVLSAPRWPAQANQQTTAIGRHGAAAGEGTEQRDADEPG